MLLIPFQPENLKASITKSKSPNVSDMVSEMITISSFSLGLFLYPLSFREEPEKTDGTYRFAASASVCVMDIF